MKWNNSEEKQDTLFHGGFFYIQRIDKLLGGLDQITMEREQEWNKEMVWKKNYSLLKALYKEIKAKMSKEDRERHENISNGVDLNFRTACKYYRSKGRISYDFISLLDEWEMELRDIIEERGLLLPDKEEDSGL